MLNDQEFPNLEETNLEDAPLPARAKSRNRARRLLVMALCLLALLLVAGIGGYRWLGVKEVQVKTSPRATEKIRSGSDLQKAAYDSLSASIHGAATGTPSAIPPTTTESGGAITPTIPPLAQPGIAATLAPPAEAIKSAEINPRERSAESQVDAANQAGAARVVAHPKTSASILFSPPAMKSVEKASATVEASPSDAREIDRPVLVRSRTLPGFGAMLPVRLMGALYTLRAGTMARMELARDIRVGNGTLKRGTIFVGAVVGSELDRAFVQIRGFIDPESGRLTKMEGELLGSDGGAGLRGKRRQVASVWAKVLDRAAQSGTQILTGVLGRRSASVIVATDPYGTYRSAGGLDPAQAQDNRSFVEVPAGEVGFILVTTLPEAANASSRLANDAPPSQDELPDTKLAELLAEANPQEIRAALPSMNPELRRIAELVLKEMEPSIP